MKYSNGPDGRTADLRTQMNALDFVSSGDLPMEWAMRVCFPDQVAIAENMAIGEMIDNPQRRSE